MSRLGELKLVGESLASQLFAIAMPKGSTVLKDWLNKYLTDMQNDGTMARFSETYLDMDYAQQPVVPTPTPLPITPTPAPCYDSMQYVSDVTVPDGTVMSPGQIFYKTWRIRNNGTCPWDSSYRLVFVQGDAMGGSPVSVNGTVSPGYNYDMTIYQIAPTQPGYYQGWWQMVNGKGVAFGPRIWVAITVPSPATAVPPPTATPPAPPTAVPTAVPTVPSNPIIYYLTATPTTVDINAMISVTWSFTGESVVSATLTRTNPDGTTTPLNGGSNVAATGSLQDSSNLAGAVIYTLQVTNSTGGTTTATAVVSVMDLVINPTQ